MGVLPKITTSRDPDELANFASEMTREVFADIGQRRRWSHPSWAVPYSERRENQPRSRR
jgi:hypothetical protein